MHLIILLIVLGLAIYIVDLLPIDGTIKLIIKAVAITYVAVEVIKFLFSFT